MIQNRLKSKLQLNKLDVRSLILTLLITGSIFFVLFSLYSNVALAAINQQINYQGKLTNNSNVTVADGLYNIEFKLYTVSSGGAAIWTETDTGVSKIQITSGLFSVMLGSTTPLTGINFNQTLYLGVNIGGTGSPSWDGEMVPRKVLGSVPAAIEAFNLGGASSTQYVRTDQPGTISTSSTQNILSIIQNGSGNLFSLATTSGNIMTVLNNGNVGIGTTAPGSKLVSQGTSAGAALNLLTLSNKDSSIGSETDLTFSTAGSDQVATGKIGNIIDASSNRDLAFTTFRASDSSMNEWMRIKGTGNVGIGTTGPLQKAVVYDNTSFTTQGTSDILRVAGHNLSSGASIGHTLEIGFSPYTQYNNWATIGVIQTSLSGYGQGDIYFTNRNGTTDVAPTEVMRITSTGNVGVGTTSPQNFLHVKSNNNVIGGGQLDVQGGVGGYGSGVLFTTATVDTGAYKTQAKIIADGTGNYNSGASSYSSKLSFWTLNADSLTQQMTILANGNVGIGTTTPAERLDVLGNLRLENNSTSPADNSPFNFKVATDPSNTAVSALFIYPSDSNSHRIFFKSPSDTTHNVYALNFTGVSAMESLPTMVNLKASGGGGANGAEMAFGNDTAAGTGIRRGGSAGDDFQLFATSPTATSSNFVWFNRNTGYGTVSNSIEQMRLSAGTSAGLNIGSSTPWAKLSIEDTYGNQQPLLDIASSTSSFISGAATSSIFRVNANGNVGIGTTTPGYKLHVKSASDIQFALDVDSGGRYTSQYFLNNGSTRAVNFWDETSNNLTIGTSHSGADLIFNRGLNAAAMTISGTTGNVGIGTTTPSTKLSVAGQGFFETSTETPVGSGTPGPGIRIGYLTSGDYGYITSSNSGVAAKNLVLQPGGTGNVGINQTVPLDLLHIAGDNIATIRLQNTISGGKTYQIGSAISGVSNAGFQIYNVTNSRSEMVIDTNGNVGIGTTAPGGKLSVSGGAAIGSSYATTAVSDGNLIVSGSLGIGTTTPGSKLDIWGNLNVATGTTPALFVNTATGNVGIGVINPGKPLDVTGDIRASGNLLAGGGNAYLFNGGVRLGNSSGEIDLSANDMIYGPNAGTTNHIFKIGGNEIARINSTGIGIGTTTPGAKLHALSTTEQLRLGYDASNYNSFTVGSTGSLTVAAVGTNPNITLTPGGTGYTILNGNVGIGTTAPGQKLDVAGNINVSTNSAYMYNGLNVITASTTLSNYFFGGSGNLTMTGNANTASGYQALYSNTTGTTNTASGFRALYSNTTGTYNTASGINALYSNTTGTRNTANGLGALYSNTTGGNNAGYGINSGYGLTTGNNNTLIGPSDSVVASYNQVTTGSNNISIGNNVAVASPTASNQLNIGNLIYGTGLNGTGATISGGNVGIGTIAPDKKLEVNLGTSDALRLTYNDSDGSAANYTDFNVSSVGSLTIAPTGTNPNITLTPGGTGYTILNGNVGIGTSTPTLPLVVNGKIMSYGNSTNQITMSPAGNGVDSYAHLQIFNTAGYGQGYLDFYTYPGQGLGTPTVRWRGVDLGSYTGGHVFSASAASQNGASTDVLFVGNTGATGVLTNHFGVGVLTNAPVSALDVNGGVSIGSYAAVNAAPSNGLIVSGNVGIGTTTPGFNLQVAGTGVSAAFGAAANNNGAGVAFLGSSTGKNFFIGNQYNIGGALEITPSTANGGSTFTTPVVTILSTGNVGIGTTAPGTKLEVVGTASSTGLQVNGNGAITGTISAPTFVATTNNIAFLSLKSLSSTIGVGVTNGDVLSFDWGGIYPKGYQFRTSATQGINIDSSGNVGIGTTAPGASLQVAGTGIWSSVYGFSAGGNAPLAVGTAVLRTGNDFRIQDDGSFKINQSGAAAFLTILNTGNVGIGTTAPREKLDVAGNITTDWADRFIGTEYQDGSTYRMGMKVVTSDRDLQIINKSAGENFSGISFHTGTGPTERMRIDKGGNVGIGTTNPGNKLVVSGAGYTYAEVDASSSSGTYSGGYRAYNDVGAQVLLDIYASSSVGTYLGQPLSNLVRLTDYSGSSGIAIGTYTNTPLTLGTNNSARLVINGAGNVGIGTTAPSAKLQVNVASGYANTWWSNDSVTTPFSAIYGAHVVGSFGQNYSTGGGADFAGFSHANNEVGVEFDGYVGGTSPTAPALLLAGWKSNGTTGASAMSGTDIIAQIAAGASPVVTVQANGNVGIGTTSPVSKLDVSVTSPGSTNFGLSVRDSTVTPTYASNADNLLTVRGAGSSVTTWKGRITAGGDNVEFLMGEYNSLAWLGAHNAALNAWTNIYINPDGGSNAYIGDSGGGVNNIPVPILAVINSTGNVGIGTTAPDVNLAIGSQLLGAQGLSGAVLNLGGSSSQMPGINIGQDATHAIEFYWIGNATPGSATAALETSGYLNPFAINGSKTTIQSAAGNVILATGGGNVGIGTTAPGGKLSVSGGAAIGSSYATTAVSDGNLIVSGSLGIGTTAPGSKIQAVGGYISTFDNTGYGPAFMQGASGVSYFGNTGTSRIAFGNNTNYERMTILDNGNVGIGTTTPGFLLTVAGTSNITGAAIFGSTLGVTGATTLSSTLGVTGQTTLANASSTNLTVSTNSYLGTVQSGTWNGTTIAVANGGTGQTTYTNGQLLIGNTTGNTLTKAALTGTTNQVVVTNSTGSITLSTPQDIATASTPTFASTTLSNFTLGSIPFFGSSGKLGQNNANFFWDGTNNRLGIGTSTPDTLLTVAGNGRFTGTLSASNLSGTNTGDVTLGAIAATPNANGASLSGQVLTLQPASTSFGGVVTTGTQSFTGDKTFTSNSLAALQVTGSNTGRTSITVQNTNASGNASFYFQNDRGSFNSYGGLLTGGSSDVGGTLFGLARADRTFLINDGTNALGLALGTLTAQPLTLGTNNLARVTILSGGNVGIGTTAPTSTLELYRGDNNIGPTLTLNNPTGNAGTAGSAIDFLGYSGASQPVTNRIKTIDDGAYGYHLAFLTKADSSGGALFEAMRIQGGTGNVGIATTTPGFPLTVTGASNFTGALNFNGAAGSSGNILQSNGSGSAPSWVSTTTLGTIAVNQGGTGQTTYTNGQLLIGNTTGNTLTKATLTGTANQVNVTNGAGSITLSTPQNIGTTSSPTFNSLNIANGSTYSGWIGNFGLGSDWVGFTADGAQSASKYAFEATASYGETVFNANGGGTLPFIDFRFSNGGVEPITRIYGSGGLYFGSVAGAADPGLQNLSIFSGKLGVGVLTASAKIHALSTTEQLRLGYDASNYNSFTVGSTGSLTVAAVGTNPNITLTPGGTGYTILNGNVGIGTTTPGAKLSVKGGGTTTGLNFQTTNSNNLPLVTILDSGNVGIGTTTPGNKLQINAALATASESLLRLSGGSTGFAGTNDAGTAYSLVFDGTAYSVGTGVVQRDGAKIEMAKEASWNEAGGGGGPLGALLFYTSAGSIASPKLTEKMRITSLGNVGIGTTAPDSKLTISSNTATLPSGAATLRIAEADTVQTSAVIDAFATNGLFNFRRADTTAASPSAVQSGENLGVFGAAGYGTSAYSGTRARVGFFADETWTNTANGTSIRFSTTLNGAATAGGTERMRIDNAGNVGIGTSTPDQALVVSGTARATNLLGGATTLSTDASGNIIRTPSDISLKENIQNIDSADALSQVLALQGVTYFWKDKARFGTAQEIGFIAQQVEPIVPQVVKSGGAYKSLNYGNLTAVLASAIQEQQKQITANASTTRANASSTASALSSLDLRVSTLENLGPQRGGGGVSTGIFEDLLSTLQSFGTEIVDGVSYMKNFLAEHLTTQNLTIKGKDITKTGFTIYDRATGDPICVYFENGIQKTSPGECPDSTATSTPPTDTTSIVSDNNPPIDPLTGSSTPPISDIGSNPPPDQPPPTPPPADPTPPSDPTSLIAPSAPTSPPAPDTSGSNPSDSTSAPADPGSAPSNGGGN